MKLIRSQEEFVRALSISSVSADFGLIESQLDAVVENFIEPVIGTPMLEAIQTKIKEVEELDDNWQGLLDRLQRPLAMIAYLRAVPLMDVNARSGGFTVNTDENSAPASKARVREFKKALWIQSQEAMNSLIGYLDKKRDEFTEYKDSAAEKRRFRNLVNVYGDWSDSVLHQAGDWVIDHMRPTITIHEEKIREVICDQLFDFFQAKITARNSDFTENGKNYAPLLPIIRRYICNATMASLVEQNSIVVTGSRAYVMLEEQDDANVTTRPADIVNRDSYRLEYKNSAGAALKMLRKKLVAGDYPLWSESPCAQASETLKPQSTNGIFPAFGVGS